MQNVCVCTPMHCYTHALKTFSVMALSSSPVCIELDRVAWCKEVEDDIIPCLVLHRLSGLPPTKVAMDLPLP